MHSDEPSSIGSKYGYDYRVALAWKTTHSLLGELMVQAVHVFCPACNEAVKSVAFGLERRASEHLRHAM